MKSIVKRKCFLTKNIVEKNLLLRIAILNKKDLEIDIFNNLKGRGIYFIPNNDNIEKICKFKILNKMLRLEIPNTFYEKLREYKNDKIN